MIFDNKIIKKSIFILVIVLLTASCAVKYRYRPLKSKPSAPKLLYVDPIKKQSQALSIYRSATAFEDEYYYDTRSIKAAEIAINKYEQYYILTPNGSYACIALLKKAELLYRLNSINEARNELFRVKTRKGFLNKFTAEIQYIEGLLF